MNYSIKPEALSNKTILITGSGDGIGKQLALDCAKQGATVILLGRTVAKLEAVYDQIISNNGPEPAIVPLDLQGATGKHYLDMANTIEDQFGALDGLVLNAGILGTLRPFAQIPEDEWQEVMQINLHSQFLMLKALLPVLNKAQSASVVFTSSGVGKKGRAYWGCYSVSKFASEGMMQILADEYANSTIRFNSINPGPTQSKLRTRAYPAEDSNSIKAPADIMTPYLYLLADESIGVNGQYIEAQK
ncbi:YciK family oxidoreductase [Neptunicella sp. SCSIO 80796]|uniref:YciK family oxidoreductase n=1 Tax=Neptunicella plasticusilytica TaxID=3117012 RepID=UPI003A4E369C